MPTPTRDRILDAALRAFATRGVDGTPITDLEAAAGLAPGSGGFYRYFATKDEVLAAVVRREVDRIEQRRPDRAPAGPRGTEEALRAMLEGLGQLRPLIALLAREHGRAPELASEVARRLISESFEQDPAWRTLLGDDAGGEAESAARGAVVLSALVGFVLATDYFGSPPAGVSSAQFVRSLASLLDGDPLPGKEHSL